MRKNNNLKNLYIEAYLSAKGIDILVEGKSYKIEYPVNVWKEMPKSIKRVLLDNITFANTHFLPLILDKDLVEYNTSYPLFESFLFKNQLYDLLWCEKSDRAAHLFYLRKFYNLDFKFKSVSSNMPDTNEICSFESDKTIAIIPFSFGKESLLTFALCRELGIKPILVYCQEQTQPYEEKYKLKKLKELGKEFNVDTYFIKNDPGLFRYGKAFGKKVETEIGWGEQTTILSLLMIPFVYKYKAHYIFLGNEYLNNAFEYKNKWKLFTSFDQTSFWTPQQSNMIKIMTNNQCGVQSSLEPLEEVVIFYILHHRYPKIGKYQFSCEARNPLYPNSQWCHNCYKCSRMYLFAKVCGIDPRDVGFKRDLLSEKDKFNNYFGKEHKTGSSVELDFCFYYLHKKGALSHYAKLFKLNKIKKLKPWNWYYSYFTKLKDGINLPKKYEAKILSIMREELNKFKKLI